MRLGVWLAVVAGVCALVVAAGAGEEMGATPQLHPNPGFEQGEGPSAAGWGLWPPTGRDVGVSSLRDPEVHKSGAYSGRLRIEPDGYEGICTWHHPAVAVYPGQELILSFWMKAEGVTGTCGADVQLRRGVTEIVGSAATPTATGTFDWKQITHRFTVPEGVTHACVVPLLRGKGTVWFDDVCIFGTLSFARPHIATPQAIERGLLGKGRWGGVYCLCSI